MAKKTTEKLKTDAALAHRVEEFCQAIMDGCTQVEAFERSHPGSKVKSQYKPASLFARRPDVQARLAELREMEEERHRQFRDTLLTMLCTEVRECWADNRTLAPVMKQVNQLAQALGMNKQAVDVTAKVGAFDSAEAAEKLNFLLGAGGGAGG